MDQSMNEIINQKTTNGKHIFFFLIFLPLAVFILIQTGCERAIIYPGELTQTSRAHTLAFTPSITPSPRPTLTSSPSLTPTPIPPTPEPTDTEVAKIVPTLSPEPLETETFTPTIDSTKNPPILYYSQSGDTLDALAKRFMVNTADITSPGEIPPAGSLIQPNQLIIVPNRNFPTGPVDRVLPDSEIIYSPSAKDFVTAEYVQQAGGYLSTYRQYLPEGWYDGAQIIDRLALENSINPRIFLAILEHQSHWVFGQPSNMAQIDYPMGYIELKDKGLYYQLGWAARMISAGYYGWRTGQSLDITYMDNKTSERLAPQLNAGTVGLHYLYSKLDTPEELRRDLYDETSGIQALYTQMFGDPWARSQSIEPLFPPQLVQPELVFPWLPGRTWALTGGPHYAWFPDAGCMAALDFAPPAEEPGCILSEQMVTSVGPGLVTRSELGIVAVDMDMDGKEQTGWTIFYLHIDTNRKDTVKVGTVLNTSDNIGHASCMGGESTGTHLHIARKFNGEWMAADGPVPFDLNGWQAFNGEKPYLGGMTRDGILATADPFKGDRSVFTRPDPSKATTTPTPIPSIIP